MRFRDTHTAPRSAVQLGGWGEAESEAAPRTFTESPTLLPHSYVTVGRSVAHCTHPPASEVGRSVGLSAHLTVT